MIRESKIQKRKQQRKIKTNQSNNNKTHGVNLGNLRQSQLLIEKNEHVVYDRIATMNIRSTKDKDVLLRNAINHLNIDITLVTETWLQNMNEDSIWVEASEFNKNGLPIHPCNQQDRKGGEIAVIIPTSFKVNQLKTKKINSLEHAVWQVQNRFTHILILGIYHPPTSTQMKNSNCNITDDLTELLATTGSKIEIFSS